MIRFKDMHEKAGQKRDLKKQASLPSTQHSKGDTWQAFQNYKLGSKRINSYLWRQHQGQNPQGHEDVKRDVQLMDRHIHAHELPKMTVWSGTSHDPRKIKNEHGIVHHPSYLSTTLDPVIAHQFARNNIHNDQHHKSYHSLKIHLPEGTTGIHNDPHGRDDESEILLPRGINLKYKKTTSFEHEDHNGQHTHFIHHMEIV